MKSIASAPGKVILFGEHFVVYGTKAILAAINKRVTVTTSNNKEKNVIINSNLSNAKLPLSLSIKDVKTTLRPFFYIAKKMIEQHNHKEGLQITIDSEIPSGVGLGSSSACCVATAGSVSGMFEKKSHNEILELALEAEKTIFSDASGADTSVCTYGGFIEYNKKNGFKKLDIHSDFELIIANSNIIHSTEEVVSKVKKFKQENETFTSLCNEEEKLIENVNNALNTNDLDSLGKAMSKNQEYLEKIGVSNEKLHSMINLAKITSYGAKITGAGNGGCIIALADKSNRQQTIDKLRNNGYECFSVKIDSNGIMFS